MSDSTPSPRAKEDGTNKRVRIQQNDNTGKRIKPPENNDNNNMEVTLTSAGQDGNEVISNPNHNPNPNPNPVQDKCNRSIMLNLQQSFYFHCFLCVCS